MTDETKENPSNEMGNSSYNIWGVRLPDEAKETP